MYKKSIATKSEVDQLKSFLQEPELNHNLNPPALGMMQVNHDLQRWRARRMDYLTTRLDLASYSMRREFDRER